MAFAEIVEQKQNDPLELFEQLADGYGWAHEREVDEEITLVVEGSWCDYRLSLNWREDIEAVHIACAFDQKIPQSRQNEIYRLLARINEQMWLGHFDYWADDGMLMFRQSLMLNAAEATFEQCEALLANALEACEFYYQAFQFVIWAGRDAVEALSTTMFETHGNA